MSANECECTIPGSEQGCFTQHLRFKTSLLSLILLGSYFQCKLLFVVGHPVVGHPV